MPTIQMSASLREMRATMRATGTHEALSTISVPADAIARWEQEIASLPARKRKNWKGNARDRMGAKCLVVYDAEGVEVPGYGRVLFLQRMSQQKQAMFDTNQAYRPVLPIGWQHDLPQTLNILSVRTGTDTVMDFETPHAQRAHMNAERRANATGNHEPRNHAVRVPTRAGEPVRG